MQDTKQQKMKVEDFTHQDYEENDDEDFEIRTIKDEQLIDTVPGLDDEREFEEDMYNYGEAEDLPDSDRETICRGEGISRKACLNR